MYHPNCPYQPLIGFFWLVFYSFAVYNTVRRNNMNDKPKQLESELHCRATAELKESVLSDLNLPDISIAGLITGLEKDESEDQHGPVGRDGTRPKR